MPESEAQYVHRLGRTARAGKAGRGLLVLADYEARTMAWHFTHDMTWHAIA